MPDAPQFDASDEPAVLRGLSPSQQERLTEILDDYLRRWSRDRFPDRSECLRPILIWGRARRVSLQVARVNQIVSGDAPSSEILGKQLGDFKLLRELGRGGMGVVYLAQQISLDRKVAVKLLPFASLLEPSNRCGLRMKRGLLPSLSIPTSCPFMRWVLKITFTLCDALHLGQSLDVVIASERAQSEKSLREIPITIWSFLLQQFAEVAEALHRAHEYGIVHRDIKPSNLILDSDQNYGWLILG